MNYVIDFETISKAKLKEIGADNYISHPSTEISVFSFKEVNKGEVFTLVNPSLKSAINQDKAKDAIRTFLRTADTVIAHNHVFEKLLIQHCFEDFVTKCLGKKHVLWNKLRYIDTLTLSNVFRGPASLENACNFFNVTEKKNTLGKSLMLKACVIQENEPKRMKTTTLRVNSTWEKLDSGWVRTGHDLYQKLVEYCEQDVCATESLYNHLKSLSPILGAFKGYIAKGIQLANYMNERGVAIDLGLLSDLRTVKQDIDKQFDEHCQKYFKVEKASKRAQIIKYLNNAGCNLEKLGKHNIKEWIKQNPTAVNLGRVLQKYTALNKPSLKKIEACYRLQRSDNRMYNMFKFSGAYATGRWTSSGMQLQNLPRTSVEYVPEVIKPEEAINYIRALIVPDSDAYRFFIADLSQIELRIALYEAGYIDEVNRLSAGEDLYQDMANKISKDCDRAIGKVAMLSAQYGVGWSKFREALMYNNDIEVTEVFASRIIRTYQQTYKNIVARWHYYQKLLEKAALTSSELKITLRTGRILNYGVPIVRYIGGHKSICFDTGTPGIYQFRSIWGGHIFQHIVQAQAADIMLIKMVNMFNQKADIRLAVHDECVMQVSRFEDIDTLTDQWDKAGAEDIEKFFPGLKLDSECALTERYGGH